MAMFTLLSLLGRPARAAAPCKRGMFQQQGERSNFAAGRDVARPDARMATLAPDQGHLL